MKTSPSRYLLAGLLSCLTTFSFAQHKVTVQLSEQYEEPKNSVVFDIAGYDEGGIFVGRYARKGLLHLNLEMEKYSHALKLLSLRDYEYTVDGDELDYSTPIYFKENLYALASTYDKHTKARKIYYHQLDTKTLSSKGAPVLLKTIQENDNGSVALADYAISPNEERLAFFGIPGYQKKMMVLAGIPVQLSSNKDEIHCSVAVFSAGMKKEWEKDITLPYTEKLYGVRSATVDDAGNFYLLGKLYNDVARDKKGGDPNFKYIIDVLPAGGGELKEFDITLDDKYITDCSFRISPQNKIICAGFYSDKGTTSIKGTFYMTIDPATKQIVSKGMKEFDTEFLKLFMSNNKAEKGQEIYNYDLDDIIVREDGGAVLIGEKYYITVSTSYNASTHTTTQTTIYHYDAIIVININPDNSIQWAARIPKRQASSSGFYLSYASFVKDDMLYLIFNDNDKNLDEKNPDKIYPYDGKNSIATLVTVQPDGNWEKSALFSNKEEGVIMRPLVAEQINDHELIIYCEKGRKYEIGKIIFE